MESGVVPDVVMDSLNRGRAKQRARKVRLSGP